MPSRKEKRKNKKASSVSTKQDNPKVEQPSATLQDTAHREGEEAEDSDEIFLENFSPEQCIKSNFRDEYDLFRHFFKRLRNSGRLTTVINGINELSERPPKKLFENDNITTFSSDPKFEPIKFTENDNEFFNVSEKVSIKFDEAHTRYAEAGKKINRGEIVCVEKSAILTGKPNTTEDGYSVHRCHHCIRIIGFFVTCLHCDVVIFCSYACRDASWYEYHVWECYGLQRSFWTTSSPEYVALRMLLLGAKYEYDTGDASFDDTYQRTPNIFNDPNHVYKYINKLSFTIRDKSQLELAQILVTLSGILVYLVEYTRFFFRLSELPKFKNTKPYDMYMFVGGTLLRHYFQAKEHQVMCDQTVMVTALFYDRLDFVSAGIFVSETVFERNCKPNALLCTRDNYVVIKATETIHPGQKITVNWHPNRELCFCQHCSRICDLNALHCMECKGSVLPESDFEKFQFRAFDYDDLFANIRKIQSPLTCKQCKTSYDQEIFELMDKEGQIFLANFKQRRNVDILKLAIEHYKNVFQPTHIYHTFLNIMFLEYYINNNMINHGREIVDVMTKYLVVVELHYGKFSKSLLSGRCSMLLHTLEMYTALPLFLATASISFGFGITY